MIEIRNRKKNDIDKKRKGRHHTLISQARNHYKGMKNFDKIQNKVLI